MSLEVAVPRVWPVAHFPELTNPYPWQQQVIEICETVPTTTCHWYWGPIIGKTTLVRHLIKNYRAYLVSTPAQIRSALKKEECKVLIIHPAYANSKRIPYDEISNAIDGAMIRTRTGTLTRNPIHVFIISNHPPDRSKLSDWKWHVQNITTTDQLPDTYR